MVTIWQPLRTVSHWTQNNWVLYINSKKSLKDLVSTITALPVVSSPIKKLAGLPQRALAEQILAEYPKALALLAYYESVQNRGSKSITWVITPGEQGLIIGLLIALGLEVTALYSAYTELYSRRVSFDINYEPYLIC
jgi:hypothetical protein